MAAFIMDQPLPSKLAIDRFMFVDGEYRPEKPLPAPQGHVLLLWVNQDDKWVFAVPAADADKYKSKVTPPPKDMGVRLVRTTS